MICARLLAFLGVGFLSAALVGGCTFPTSTTSIVTERETGPAMTPREALVMATVALYQPDEAALMTLLEANAEQKEFIKVARLEYLRTMRQFRSDFIKAYGELAWWDFQDPTKAPKGAADTHFIMSEVSERKQKAEQAQIEDRGEEAFAVILSVDGQPEPWRLLKIEGFWKVDARSLCPFSGMKEMLATTRARIDLTRKYQKAIGKPGIKPEDIDVELGRALMKLTTGEEGDFPRRFDIHQIK